MEKKAKNLNSPIVYIKRRIRRLDFILLFLHKTIVYYAVLFVSYWVLFRSASPYGDSVNVYLLYIVIIIAILSLIFALFYCLNKDHDSQVKSIIRFDLILYILAAISLLFDGIIIFSHIGDLKLVSMPLGVIFTANSWVYRAVLIAVCLSVVLTQLWDRTGWRLKPIRYFPWILYVISTLMYSYLCVQRHNLFHSFTMDLAGYDQAVWLISRFHTPASSIYHLPHYIGDHFEPILYLLSPIYWIWDDARMLLISQAAIAMLGIFPVYGLAKKYLGQWSATVFAVAYIFFIGLQYALEFDFHTLTLVTPLLAYVFYFLDKKEYLKYWIFILLVLLCKAAVSIYVIFIGIYALARKKWLLGVVTILLGISWYVIATKIMVPYLSHRVYGYVDAYHALGDGPLEIIITIITKPFYTIQILLTPADKLSTFLLLFGSFGLLSFLAPPILILALPMIGEKFLTSDREANWKMWWHYSITILPVLIYSSVIGIKNLSEKLINYKKDIISVACCTILIMVFSISFFYYTRPPRPAPLLHLLQANYYLRRDQHLNKLETILKNIPQNASVATQDVIAPHIAHRKEVYRIKHVLTPETDYVIMDFSVGYWPWSKEEFSEILNQYKNNPQYWLELNDYPLFVFRRNN